MHLLSQDFIEILLIICFNAHPIDNKPVLVQIMAFTGMRRAASAS